MSVAASSSIYHCNSTSVVERILLVPCLKSGPPDIEEWMTASCRGWSGSKVGLVGWESKSRDKVLYGKETPLYGPGV